MSLESAPVGGTWQWGCRAFPDRAPAEPIALQGVSRRGCLDRGGAIESMEDFHGNIEGMLGH
jgi:hypothetical protein